MTRLAKSPRTAGLAAALAAIATVVLAGPAAAGGGVRLTFGGPLGTFVATPTPGYGGAPAHVAPRKAKAHHHHDKPAPRPHATVARAAPSPKPRVEREAPTRKPLATIASIEPVSTPPILVSRSLTAAALPASETVTTVGPDDTLTAVEVAGAPAAEAVPAAPVVTTPEPAAGPIACRKFIPAVGVTVTVSCD